MQAAVEITVNRRMLTRVAYTECCRLCACVDRRSLCTVYLQICVVLHKLHSFSCSQFANFKVILICQYHKYQISNIVNTVSTSLIISTVRVFASNYLSFIISLCTEAIAQSRLHLTLLTR